MKKFGLLGKNIEYSFSRKYFNEKFQKENIDAEYVNFDIPEINEFSKIIRNNENLGGLNVTIPYKLDVIKFLDLLSADAENIGAVNVIKIEKDLSLTGYNTDYIGFKDSLSPHLMPHHTHALILGTGGASKAVAYALKTLGISYKFVSRSAGSDHFTYKDLNKEILLKYSLIINTTPLGTFPNVDQCPDIPYHFLTKNHLVYDLIYNPDVTTFMKNSVKNNATAINGKEMLELQAQAAWLVWNS